MNKSFKTLLITVATVGALSLSSQPALANMLDSDDFSKEQLASIKVSMTEAITKAEKMQSGIAVKAKLEKEDGKLVYEIEFIDNGKETEVMVDAVNGNAIPGID